MTRKRCVLFAAVLTVLAGSVVAWTQTSTTFKITITAGGAGGQLLDDFEPIGGTFSIVQGAAQKVSGIELYKIVLGDTQFSNEVTIEVALLDPEDMGKVFNNPNAFIDVGVWYPDPNQEEPGRTSVTQLDHDNTWVLRDEGSKASDRMMSRLNGGALLFPSVAGQNTLYVLASIMVPGGAPPGQQKQGQFNLWCNVTK